MMKNVNQGEWIGGLKPGDIGLILSSNMFSTMQNWLRRKNKDPLRASHSFLVTNPPSIVEANGLFVSYGKLIKFIGSKTQCWIFRYRDLTEMQLAVMLAYTDGMVDSHGHYGVRQIASFAREFFRKCVTGDESRPKDSPGVICSELTGKAIVKARIPYIKNEEPYSVTPSEQRSWLSFDGTKVGWVFAQAYDGQGNFYINDEEEK